jgi:hypothetical protein
VYRVLLTIDVIGSRVQIPSLDLCIESVTGVGILLMKIMNSLLILFRLMDGNNK